MVPKRGLEPRHPCGLFNIAGINGDKVRYVRDKLAELNAALAVITESAEHLAGPQPEPEVPNTADLRSRAKDRLLYADHVEQLGTSAIVGMQTRAAGSPDIV